MDKKRQAQRERVIKRGRKRQRGMEIFKKGRKKESDKYWDTERRRQRQRDRQKHSLQRDTKRERSDPAALRIFLK